MKYLGQKGAQVLVNKIKSSSLPEGTENNQILKWDNDNSKAVWTTLELDDVAAYGVRIDQSVADPHLTRIGNMTYHKTLPIQSKLAGCIATHKGSTYRADNAEFSSGNIQYWLDPNDWRFRKTPVIKNMKLTVASGSYTLTDDIFKTLQYEQQYVKVSGLIAQVTSIDTTNGVATLTFEATTGLPTASSNSISVELGSVRNGYDGNVMIYYPTFYIKSKEISSGVYDILISESNANTNGYYKQSEGLMSAYRATLLRTVPKNMGYLSTFDSTNYLISVANTHDYCRGGANSSDYDSYLSTDRFRTDLGKPVQNEYLSSMRQLAGDQSHIIQDYTQYKNVMYWLWVIEYANFNSQEDYNAALTPEGYHQGGMGPGVTDWDYEYWYSYNNHRVITPCGFGDEYGNKTTVIDQVVSSHTFHIPRWRGITNPFGDYINTLDGIVIKDKCYIIEDPNKFTDSATEAAENAARSCDAFLSSGYQKTQVYGTCADILPNDVGSDATTYICDYTLGSGNDGYTYFLSVGGDTRAFSTAGLACYSLDSDRMYNGTFRFLTYRTY